MDAVCRTGKEGNTIPLKATQDTGPLQGVAIVSWLRVARPLLGASVAPPAPHQPGEQNDSFPCFSSMPVIMVNYKAPVMTTERQIDLFLLIVAVLKLARVMGAQISHLIMALPEVDVSTIGT